MPHAKEFLQGFDLVKGTQISGYTLIQAHATHETIKRYHEYRYDIKLIFRKIGNGSYNSLYNSLLRQLSGERIIYGIKNPYKCTIDLNPDVHQDNNGDYIFQFVGHAVRS